jgi:DNA modification methylase
MALAPEKEQAEMAEIIQWENCRVRLGDLKKWEENPAEIDKESAARLVESFNEFGQVQALAIDPENRLIDGHQRLDVWLGKFGPEFIADCRKASRSLTLKERQKIAVYLRSAAVGHYNWDKLANWDPTDLKEWGFDARTLKGWKIQAASLKEFLDSTAPDENDAEPKVDQAAELQKKWKVKPGDIWTIGEHKLLCGDATNYEHISRLMGEEKADLVFTDPPYGVEYCGNKDFKIWKKLENDGKEKFILGEFLEKAFLNYHKITIDTCAIYCFYSSSNHVIFQEALEKTGWIVKQQIIWLKGWNYMPYEHYNWSHEPIFYAHKKGFQSIWFGDRSQRTTIGKGKSAYENATRETLLKIVLAMLDETTVWEIDKDIRIMHSTQKPIHLAIKAINNSSPENGIVADFFAGSGSTMVACQNTGRICRAIELSPEYCAVILQRMTDAFLGIEISRERLNADQ